MGLVVWKASIVSSEEQAAQLVERFEVDRSVFEASGDVLAFYDDVLAKYPGRESFLEEELLHGAPTSWSVTPERSDRAVFFDLVRSVSTQMLDDIAALARQYEPVLYDPRVRPSSFPAQPEEPIRRDPLVLRQVLFGLLAGILVVAVGWVMPVPVLD